MTEIVVRIASYKRPDDLRRLLQSLARQCGVDRRFGLAIADNDPAGSARSTVDTIREHGIPGCYAVEPDPGIPAARNRSLALAREMGARCAGFIDDDEVASEHWLATLFRRLNTEQADAVGGPVEPVFPGATPAGAAPSRLFSPTGVRSRGGTITRRPRTRCSGFRQSKGSSSHSTRAFDIPAGPIRFSITRSYPRQPYRLGTGRARLRLRP